MCSYPIRNEAHRKMRAKVMHGILLVLREADGPLSRQDVITRMEESIELDEWARGLLPKSGRVRWRSMVNFYSIGCIKAEFLVKKRGIWHLTPKGEEASHWDPEKVFEVVGNSYKEWKKEREGQEAGTDEEDSIEDESGSVAAEASMAVEEVEQTARDVIRSHLATKNGYEFQDLVAALLRGMGYYTPFVAPKGKDGGVDILAYRDPFGIDTPRMKVQVKHRQSPASVQEIRELMGLLQVGGDVGLFVSTGGFTADARATVTHSPVHVQLVDMDGFIDLWQDFYKKLPDEDKNLLPLVSVYFLAPTE